MADLTTGVCDSRRVYTSITGGLYRWECRELSRSPVEKYPLHFDHGGCIHQYLDTVYFGTGFEDINRDGEKTIASSRIDGRYTSTVVKIFNGSLTQRSHGWQ